MKSYFIRHKSKKGEQLFEHQQALFDAGKIAIHFDDVKSWEIKDHASASGKSAIKIFRELADEGGYVWARYGNIEKDVVGIVKPGAKKEMWKDTYLKALTLSRRVEVPAAAHLSMRVAMPMGTVSRWKAIGKRLEYLVEGKSVPRDWTSLMPSQHETICAEYLRETKGDMGLSQLLLPVGRTMKDVDIFGMTRGGGRLFGQVTYKKQGEITSKIKALEAYGKDRKDTLVFFSPHEKKGRLEALRAKHPRVRFIETESVWSWLKTKKKFFDKIFE